MKKGEYSEIYPKLPKIFDDLEESIYWGVRNFSLSVNNSIKDLKNNNMEIINKFDSILNSALNDIVEHLDAIKILEEMGVYQEYQEGARFYVIKHLKSYSIINEFLEIVSVDYKEKLIQFILKGFFDYLYGLYKFA
ncbi:MAG: hypothetical protein JXA99_03500 [Candidatus Lokiarchaeota archaeon]|nr:hypothetical protein [Candidatus Lokiarchaeota archaeon]